MQLSKHTKEYFLHYKYDQYQRGLRVASNAGDGSQSGYSRGKENEFQANFFKGLMIAVIFLGRAYHAILISIKQDRFAEESIVENSNLDSGIGWETRGMVKAEMPYVNDGSEAYRVEVYEHYEQNSDEMMNPHSDFKIASMLDPKCS